MDIIFFFLNDTATTEIYTLSLHDALPIYAGEDEAGLDPVLVRVHADDEAAGAARVVLARLLDGVEGAEAGVARSEEHTSELQSRQYLVCRLLLEKKKKQHSTLLHITCALI